METRRWTNPSQPQTLYLAVVLFYINAVMSLIFGNYVGRLYGLLGLIAFIVGSVAAGLGIANEKKWGYFLGIAVAAFQLTPFLWVIAVDGVGAVFDLGFLLAIVFPVVLFALLVHPMSRDYQRIWFR